MVCAIPCGTLVISIHALREEGDPGALCHVVQCSVFLSTPSARRATSADIMRECHKMHFYPRPPRGGRRCGLAKSALPRVISIHALREEGDFLRAVPDAHAFCDISIHALREEGDRRSQHQIQSKVNFYPRPPRGGRRQQVEQSFSEIMISIHALREEGDGSRSRQQCQHDQFLSTPSARRATLRQHHRQTA